MKVKSDEIKNYSISKLYKLMNAIIERMKNILKEETDLKSNEYNELKKLYILISTELIERNFKD